MLGNSLIISGSQGAIYHYPRLSCLPINHLDARRILDGTYETPFIYLFHALRYQALEEFCRMAVKEWEVVELASCCINVGDEC